MIGAGAIAAGWVGFTAFAMLAGRALPLGVSPAAAVVIGILAVAFAIWCARADEVWHLAPNRLEHRVGIGRLGSVQRYSGAELGMLAHWNKWGKPFGRLYVVDSRGRHYLFERDADEASVIADFVCSQTGWQRRDFPPGSAF